jgi:hypothetical protein
MYRPPSTCACYISSCVARKRNVVTLPSSSVEDGHGLVDLEHRMDAWEIKKERKTKIEVHHKITERCILQWSVRLMVVLWIPWAELIIWHTYPITYILLFLSLITRHSSSCPCTIVAACSLGIIVFFSLPSFCAVLHLVMIVLLRATLFLFE